MPDQPQAICLRCGQPNLEGETRCHSCKSPLGDFSSASPWEMGSAEHSAYHEPTDPRIKPIVFFGVWLFFGTFTLYHLFNFFQFFSSKIEFENTVIPSFDELLALTIPALVTFGSLWALVSVSRRFLGKTRPPTE